jgi:hypothetical protein
MLQTCEAWLKKIWHRSTFVYNPKKSDWEVARLPYGLRGSRRLRWWGKGRELGSKRS